MEEGETGGGEINRHNNASGLLHIRDSFPQLWPDIRCLL